MSGEDLLSLRIVEAMLGTDAPMRSQHGDPSDMDVKKNEDRSDEVLAALRSLFAKLLAYEREFELDLLESRNVIGMNVSYGLVFQTDDDSNVTCVEAAVVDYGHGTRFGIKLGSPLVRELIGSDLDASTGDKVRVLTYLVRVGRQAVGFGGKHVGFLVDAERLLRDLVGVMRLEQCRASGDAADRGQGEADDVEPIHEADSTREVSDGSPIRS